MPDIDTRKLQAFVEAALTNPRHPLYQIGYAQSPILQHYAVNVAMLPSVKPQQWFKDYPDWTAKLNEAMVLCESMAAEDARAATAGAPDVTALRAEVKTLSGRLDTALAALEAGKPKPAPTDDDDDEDDDEK